jgi:hypothetical protein
MWVGLGKQKLYTILVGKPDGKRPFGRQNRRWEDNNKMGVTEAGCKQSRWLELAEECVKR